MNVDQTLAKRQSTHGDFKQNAECAQALKFVCHQYKQCNLTAVQQEALDNICQKMSRILTGNPNHQDSWHDLAGYATLVEKNLDNS